MITDQIRWVAVNEDGEITGPCMKTENECIYALVVGYRRARRFPSTYTVSKDWNKIKKLGYNVVKCKITIIKEKDKIEETNLD